MKLHQIFKSKVKKSRMYHWHFPLLEERAKIHLALLSFSVESFANVKYSDKESNQKMDSPEKLLFLCYNAKLLKFEC